MSDQQLLDETSRLAALDRYEVLDTPAEAAFDRITNLVRRLLGVPMSAVSLIDRDRQWFKSHPGLDVSETPREVAFCNHTIRGRDPLVVTDAGRDERFRDNPLVTGAPGIGSYAGVPLETPDGYNLGSLCAIDTKAREFDPAQIEILKELAALVVEQLELRLIADRDALSGALTRRAFIVEIDRAIALFHRHRRPAALVIVDIDHFKRVNDDHGHPMGDRAIRALATLCTESMRPSDAMGRMGGEEFGLLLPEANLEDAAQAARRLCEMVGRMEVSRDPPLRITASFGIAALTEDRMSSDRWIAAADAALYEAKRAGRNRVVLAPS